MQASDAAAAVSAVSVTAHAEGALLLALTFSYLSRLRARNDLRRWGLAWVWLLIALLAVLASMVIAGRAFWVVYLVADWYFLAYLLIGCGELVRGGPAKEARTPWRRLLVPGLPAAAILAGTVAPFFDDFGLLFALQAAVLAAGFAAGFLVLGRAPAARRTVGFHLMRLALAWLTMQFLLYVPLYLVEGLRRLAGERQHFAWLGYSSLADLCAQALLAIGMVVASRPVPGAAAADEGAEASGGGLRMAATTGDCSDS